jgi:endonuclease/exonuclease/phosphatase family metal-dependent hydrolase
MRQTVGTTAKAKEGLVKQFYPIIAFLVMLAGAWFFFTNWQVDLSNSPQLVPRAANGAPQFPSLTDLFPTQPPASTNNPLSTNPASASTLTPPAWNAAPGNVATNNPVSPSTPAYPASSYSAPTNTMPAAPSNTTPGAWSWAQAAGKILGGQPAAPTPTRDTIRVASFNIQVFGEDKMSQPDIVNILCQVVRQFDIVAIQEIRSRTQDVLPNFVQALNSTGRRYDYVIGPRLGRSNSKEQYAYVFDTNTVEVDRRSIYTVSDPDDLMHREPLVAWFRCKGVDPRAAFTFSLVNVHIDPDEVAAEVDVLDDVFLAVRDDGRHEDDVILLGDLNANEQHLGHLGRLANMGWVVSNLPTNTRGDKQYDNLFFDRTATAEFTGRGGVFDFMREYNLSQEQALRVSDHLVVWAEFNVHEGGVPGHVAAQPGIGSQSYQGYPRPRETHRTAYPNLPAYQARQGYVDPRYAQPPANWSQYNQPQYAQPQYTQPQNNQWR